jgi:hypothetical protein
VTPAITVPRVWARWVFNAAKRLLGPNVASFSFRTRPLSQAMGNQREFFRDIENTLYDLENDGVFVTWTSYYSWVNSITGMNVWQNLSQMHVVAPVAEVTVGRDGVKVTSS